MAQRPHQTSVIRSGNGFRAKCSTCGWFGPSHFYRDDLPDPYEKAEDDKFSHVSREKMTDR